MKDKIAQIISYKKMNLANFADTINISRSTISHILNGRNLPTYNILLKIVSCFPDISRDWLFFDEGPMIAAEGSEKSSGNGSESQHENLLFPPETGAEPKYQPDFGLNNRINHVSGSDYSQQNVVIKEVDNTKTISKIMIIYSDNTFENFIPENQDKKGI